MDDEPVAQTDLCRAAEWTCGQAPRLARARGECYGPVKALAEVMQEVTAHLRQFGNSGPNDCGRHPGMLAVSIVVMQWPDTCAAVAIHHRVAHRRRSSELRSIQKVQPISKHDPLSPCEEAPVDWSNRPGGSDPRVRAKALWVL